MKEIIKVNNKYKGLSEKKIKRGVTKRVEKLINADNKNT